MSELIEFDKVLQKAKNTDLIGIDEVGRGCVAGPLVAAGVSWDKEVYNWKNTNPEYYEILSQIKDSKKISKKKREKLSDFILENAAFNKIIEISPDQIDENGILNANIMAFNKILDKADTYYPISDYVKIGEGRKFNRDLEMYIKGDEQSLAVASASIIAKIYRDKLMRDKYSKIYPEYEFEKNAGYGTKAHINAIKKFGYSKIHRKSFKIKSIVS